MTTLLKISNKYFNALRPPKKLTLSEWADQYAILSAESSAEAGRWRTIPYQKGIMDAFTDPKIEEIWVMKSARVGFTKCLNHLIGYHIHQDPCSIMLVQPTIEDAEGYSKEEIAPMIRDTPVLKNLVSDAKSRDGNNTILGKSFPGGNLGLVGANSPRGFRRVSRRVVLFDEVDGYPVGGAGEEGDQIKLGKKRSEYYWNRKIVGGSTPTVKDLSRIEKAFLSGDQRRFFVPCPHCKHMQYLKWSHIKWPENEPHNAFYVCEQNGCIIEHSEKRWMVENGEYRATAPGNGKLVSFHIWAAYSFSPNASWGQLATEFVEAKKDAQLLKTFVNTVLGETWEEQYAAKLGASDLMDRAEPFNAPAPAGVLLVTAAVDVQDDRLEITRWGWGRDEESWVIDHHVIKGDPGRPEIWKQLDSFIQMKVEHETSEPMDLSVVAIDSGGHHTQTVYNYTRERRNWKTFVLAIKGSSQRGKPIISKPSPVDINIKGQMMKSGAKLYMVGTDTAKSLIYNRLKFNQPGPGYIHFNTDLTSDYFDQLTSEKQITRYVKGYPIQEWVKKPNVRNECLDLAVYNYAAFYFYLSQYNRKTFWDQMERRVVPKSEGTNNSDTTKQSNHKVARGNKVSSSRGSFVTSW